ncbi:unnamed protein product [Taenia asiatica]|uniref:Ras-associating domain-containing protein n=1 Tax=Taenia asiatica TaxID=60517 RepID=A0A158RA74_TAEAS|nr:unnamed protein product [Taenia asiatica]
MSFPFKPSTSKSGRLTRQANVISGGSHSHGTPSTPDSFLQSLNPRSTLLLHAELPKPMSRLPEIRLDDGSSESGGKVQVGQVKPQKSCESYDSAASGMSWSSSQSTVAVGGGYCNSTSVSGNPSFASYEEDDESPQIRSQQQIVRIPSTPGALQRAQYSPWYDSTQRVMGQPFGRDFSFEEVHVTSEQPHEQTKENRASEERNEVVASPGEKTAEFFDSVFDEQEKEVRTINLFRLIFTAPYPLGNSKFGLAKKKSGSEEPEGKKIHLIDDYHFNVIVKKEADHKSEIDPVYQLLKSAATQRHLPAKSSVSFDHCEHRGQSPRLSSTMRYGLPKKLSKIFAS